MDEKSNPLPSEEGPELHDPERTENAERLVARLAQLRRQLEAIAPPDQVRARQALDRIRDAYERIETLDAMLATAREREHELTVQLVRDRGQIAEYEGRVSELSTIADRVANAEESRRQAELVAEERLRALAVAEADVLTLRAESTRLRSRCAELEADLRSVSEQIAAAAIARTRAARLLRERNEARERAYVERKLAAADRVRASDAELRATELQGRLRDAERRIIQIANQAQEEGSDPVTEGDERSAPSEPPWIELQRTSKDPEPAVVAQPELPLVPPRQPASGVRGPDVIDLTTEDERAAGDDEERPGETDLAEGEQGASSASDSLLGRLIHQRRNQ